MRETAQPLAGTRCGKESFALQQLRTSTVWPQDDEGRIMMKSGTTDAGVESAAGKNMWLQLQTLLTQVATCGMRLMSRSQSLYS